MALYFILFLCMSGIRNKEKTCNFCGVVFKCHHDSQLYCSKRCGGLARSNERKEMWLKGEIEVTERPALKRYVSEVKGYKCRKCGINEWNNEYLSLQLDHIDGNPTHNKIENLGLICPNCHSQTPFYAGKNRGNGRKSRGFKTH